MTDRPTPWIKLDYAAIDQAKEPWDGDEVLTYVEVADTDIIHLAWWDDGSLWEHHNAASAEVDRGWYSYENSVTQAKLDGRFRPTHWFPVPRPLPRSRSP